MIRLDRVSKDYAGAGPAVRELSLDIPRGETVVLVGPSGCGKTTTLKMINRLVEPSGGTIELDGRDVRSLPAHELRLGIGYVIQQMGLFPHRTVGENIATVPRLLGWPRERITARVGELVELMGLDPALRDRYPAELSGGQQQRVGVARALAADPPVLLMDEPFGALDPLVRERLQDELVQLQERLRKTIVFVTHDIDEATRLGDRIAILNVGGVLEQYAPPADILRDPTNEFVASFLGAERGLKRLSLVTVGDIELPRGPVLDASADAERASAVMDANAVDWIGVLDGERLRGWLARADIEATRPLGDHEVRDFRVWIDRDATLREALDALVNTANQVAVVYDGERYIGMLSVGDIAGGLR